jgi:hypothetical protein
MPHLKFSIVFSNNNISESIFGGGVGGGVIFLIETFSNSMIRFFNISI